MRIDLNLKKCRVKKLPHKLVGEIKIHNSRRDPITSGSQLERYNAVSYLKKILFFNFPVSKSISHSYDLKEYAFSGFLEAIS